VADAGLAEPADDSELYDLEPEALRLKAYMTGDIFTGVTIDDEEKTIAIAGHPCVIRGSGGQLQRRIPCCLVGTSEPTTYANWPSSKTHLFPLSDALSIGTNRAVQLLEWRSVRGKDLVRDRRRGTLTERGVYIFQQRFTHAITRCVVPIAAFEKTSKHVLREAELEFDWISELAPQHADHRAIADLVTRFHALLDTDGRRALLRQEGGESSLRRIVHAAITEAKR